MTWSRSSCTSGDTYEVSLVHWPCVLCVALSPLSHSGGWAGGWHTSLCFSLIDRQHHAGKVVHASRENDGPLCAPRGIRRPPPEVEPVFCATSLYGTLCKMYSKCGDNTALLEVWSKCICFSPVYRMRPLLLTIGNCRLVEGEWTDPEIPDPLSDMFALLRPGTIRR